jgi:hypothetical protein
MAGTRKDGTLPGEQTESSLGYWVIMLYISFVLFLGSKGAVSGKASSSDYSQEAGIRM